jgi:hypothetical protein
MPKDCPQGTRDPTRRRVINKVMQEEGIFEKYGAETNGEYTRCRVTVKTRWWRPATLSRYIQ